MRRTTRSMVSGDKVPNSCIESAEFIIQMHKQKSNYTAWGAGWKPNTQRKPHVKAVFGGGIEVNITTEDLSAYDWSKLVDYKFGDTCPKLGEGIILMRRKWADKGYNLHCGAIVQVQSAFSLISNMMESFTKKVELASLSTYTIKKASDFRNTSSSFTESEFAIGLLQPV